MTRTEFIRRVRACERRLYRAARTMLPSEADCEDAVQEALLKAWSNLGTLREAAYFETWLMRILINQCKSYYRGKARAETGLTEDIPCPETWGSPLLDALKAMPRKLGITVELHYIEGYSVRECAGILGIPEGTVKWRLHQGRAQIRRAYGEEDAE